VYARYAPALHRLAVRLLGREADAWDAVQEVFCGLIEQPSGFRGEAQPMTYLYRTMTNHCLNVLRAQSRRDAREREDLAESASDGLQGPAEARALLRQLATQLDDRALQIAALHFVEGLTQEEIGAVVGLSRKWVGQELQKVQALAQQLGEGSASG
jgi:RNA polymerase sigma-70 factor (ECF subfamily)